MTRELDTTIRLLEIARRRGDRAAEIMLEARLLRALRKAA